MTTCTDPVELASVELLLERVQLELDHFFEGATNTIFVGNIGPTVSQALLRSVFGMIGDISVC